MSEGKKKLQREINKNYSNLIPKPPELMMRSSHSPPVLSLESLSVAHDHGWRSNGKGPVKNYDFWSLTKLLHLTTRARKAFNADQDDTSICLPTISNERHTHTWAPTHFPSEIQGELRLAEETGEPIRTKELGVLLCRRWNREQETKTIEKILRLLWKWKGCPWFKKKKV